MKIFLILLMSAMCFAGCGSGRQEADPENGVYNIYYLDKNATLLSPLPYEVKQMDQREVISELMEQLCTVPRDADVIPAMGENVKFESFSLDRDVLYLYFDERYGDLKTDRKALCNAALTDTLLQVEGVRYVGIYSGGQPLVGETGTLLGPFGENDFVTGISDVNGFNTIDLTLYFSDAAGTTLEKEVRTLTYRVDTPVEQLIVEQLIAGPQGLEHMAILPGGTRILNISVNENICYLNLSREFLDPIPIEDPYVPIYAIVNSLSELQTVQRVQISVDGVQNMQYREVVPLDVAFERDLDYISDME